MKRPSYKFKKGEIFIDDLKIDYNSMFIAYPDVVNVDQLREMLGGIGVTLAYRLLKEKVIYSIKIGREYKIPKKCIITYLIKNRNGC